MERIERHDVLNAAVLAVMLMGLAFGFLFGARSLLGAFSEESATVSSSTEGENASGPLALDLEEDDSAAPATAPEITAPTTTVPQTTTVPEDVAHTPAEVIVRVANGARRGGIAGKGTAILQQAGYQALTPGNTDVIERSVVYYQPTYKIDGDAVASLLAIAPDNVLAMPENPGISVNEANLVIILGVDSSVG